MTFALLLTYFTYISVKVDMGLELSWPVKHHVDDDMQRPIAEKQHRRRTT